MNKHVVLAGDSIFDNAMYVADDPCLTDQLREVLSDGSSVSMIAVDGDYVGDVWRQVSRLPEGATNIFVSAGGNDALRHAHKLNNDYSTSVELFREWADIQADFRRDYQLMLKAILELELDTAVCTVYDAVPTIGAVEVTALSLFNDVILREAVCHGIPIVDLRQVCTDSADYSQISPIEPSSQGGAKIAAVLKHILNGHDFSSEHTVIYR